MSGIGGAVAAPDGVATDNELVQGVRAGDDLAFEELYRRYHRRVAQFLRRMIRDEARAEDVTQEAFMSAYRRLLVTDAPIAFKPWIFEIARNASIDLYRRTSRAEEVSVDYEEGLRQSDRIRLVGDQAPEVAVLGKERFGQLQGALDELSDTHHRVIVLRELEGLSYREIGERMELTRPAVESTLFRARRRLEHEFEEIDTGRRCETVREAIVRLAKGVDSEADHNRVARHAKRCHGCRRWARDLGVMPPRRRGWRARVAALLPLPAFLRRRLEGDPLSGNGGVLGSLAAPGSHIGAALAEHGATVLAALALAGTGAAGGSAAASGEPSRATADGAARTQQPVSSAGRDGGVSPRVTDGRSTATLQSPSAARPVAGPKGFVLPGSGGLGGPSGEGPAPAAPSGGAPRQLGELLPSTGPGALELRGSGSLPGTPELPSVSGLAGPNGLGGAVPKELPVPAPSAPARKPHAARPTLEAPAAPSSPAPAPSGQGGPEVERMTAAPAPAPAGPPPGPAAQDAPARAAAPPPAR